MTDFLTPDDAAWFHAHPQHDFRFRRVTDAERDETCPTHNGLGCAMCLVRRSDGAMKKFWDVSPERTLRNDDEERAKWFAQWLPNPPPLTEPEMHIDFDALTAPTDASIRALADDALARGVISTERHDAIVAEPEAHVLSQIGFADDGAAGPRLRVGAKISPDFLAEIGLPERQS